MKPYVICHMVSSVDGRTLGSRWRPQGIDHGGLFERLHDQLGGDAWVIGRVTGQEFAKAQEAYPDHTDQTFPREPWLARRDAGAYGIVLDAYGKITWRRADIGGDPIVVVLTEQVSDAHLAGLRTEGVSYIFAGERALDLGLALEILNRELGGRAPAGGGRRERQRRLPSRRPDRRDQPGDLPGRGRDEGRAERLRTPPTRAPGGPRSAP